ncbi:hypothetical protein [Cryptosporangium japonicum]|uniref:Uncharacterized protein n=1 Tax=Cryptosporangium japonicum TaxID=80872 RepID=A0ABN0V220_9ACTN
MTEADLSDVAEQNRPVADEDTDPTPVIEDPEAPDADAIEQSQSVPIDEDDYR